MTKRYVLKNAKTIFTFDENDRVIEDADIAIEGNTIIAVGKNLDLKDAEYIDMTGKAVLPGFVNCHHHFFQAMFRGIRSVQGLPLFPWLKGLYQFFQYADEQTVYDGATVAISELIRTGCTTTSDHHYLFPKGAGATFIDREIDAAQRCGIRFHATRGAMTLGEDQGGLPPMSVVEKDEDVLLDAQRLIDTYHDPSELSMLRVAIAPCAPFNVSKELMIESAKLARKNHVMLHTHLSETIDENDFCMEMYGVRPLDLMEQWGWIGEDVWFAHGIHYTDEELPRLKGVGISHCPSSNMKLGSGICRVTELQENGVKVGIGVDGSASNDGSNMLEEIRRAYLLNHLHYGDDGLSAYETLKMATQGGAAVLGRDDIGILAAGKAADVIAISLDDIAYAGCEDPAVSIVNCGNNDIIDFSMINGDIILQNGELLRYDQKKVASDANQHAREIWQRNC